MAQVRLSDVPKMPLSLKQKSLAGQARQTFLFFLLHLSNYVSLLTDNPSLFAEPSTSLDIKP